MRNRSNAFERRGRGVQMDRARAASGQADDDARDAARPVALEPHEQEHARADAATVHSQVTSKEKTCATSVVPTLAPSITASAIGERDQAARREGGEQQRGRGRALQQRR